MKHNKDDMQKELRELKTTSSLNPQDKKAMISVIRKHARKKPKRKKLKQAAIWASTAAALFLAGILVFQMIDNDQSVLPADDHEGSEHDDNTDNKEPADNTNEEGINNTSDSPGFSVTEDGTKSKTIEVEGMEEEVTVTNYMLEPYGIHYQMEEFLGNYHIENEIIRHYSDADNTWVTFEVAEGAHIDDVVPEIQSQYSGDFSYTEEPAETSQNENPYLGIRQHFSDPPQGYYAYQIGENVLIIKYEYIIEAGDGMGPRLQSLRESIE